MQQRNAKCGTPKIIEESPEFLAGLEDGRQPWAGSAPDMRRGREYAMGWITGRWVSDPPSLKRH
jgi:hypothetical protein